MTDLTSIKLSPVVYLACPFSDNSPNKEYIQKQRIEAANYVTAKLQESGMTVFSPVSQNPQTVRYIDPRLADDHQFWMEHCLKMLSHCDILVVIELVGVTSKGVQMEITQAREHGQPILIWQDSIPGHDVRQYSIAALTAMNLGAIGMEEIERKLTTQGGYDASYSTTVN